MLEKVIMRSRRYPEYFGTLDSDGLGIPICSSSQRRYYRYFELIQV
jgi:hypothetical protein